MKHVPQQERGWITTLGAGVAGVVLLGATMRPTPAGTLVPAVDLRIDAAASVNYNFEYPSRSRNLFGIVHAAPLDSILLDELGRLHDTTHAPDQSLKPRVVAELGAESGDPLLNSYLGTPRPNRDHFTRTTASLSGPLYGFAGSYLYQDCYSDRFDSLWETAELAAHPMHFSEKGLAEELTAVAYLTAGSWGYRGTASDYGYWGATPVYATPLLLRGVRSSHELDIVKRRTVINARLLLDSEDWYFDHDSTPEFRNRPSGAMTLSQAIGPHAMLGVRTGYDPHYDDAANVESALRAALGRISLGATAGVYGTTKAYGSGDIELTVLRGLTIEGNAGLARMPAAVPFTYREGIATADYRSQTAAFPTAHGALQFSPDIVPSIAVRAWADFQGKTYREQVTTIDSTHLLVVHSAAGGHYSSAGVAGSASRTWGRLGLEVSGAYHRALDGGPEQLFVPWTAECAARHGDRTTEVLFAEARLRATGPATLALHEDGQATTRETATRFSLWIGSRIPFRSPLWGDKLASAFSCTAGPIHLPDNRRSREYPGGNPIGTLFAIGLDFSVAPQREDGIRDVRVSPPGMSPADGKTW